MPLRKLLSLATLILLSSFAEAQDPHQVLFEGTVTAMIDHDERNEPLAEADVVYPPVSDAAVKIKGTGLIKETTTDGQGRYSLKITQTIPVLLFFDGGGELKPELQMLTADSQKPQTINVTLMTYEQFTQRFGRQVLIDDLERINRILRKYDDMPEKDLEIRMKRFADFILRIPNI